MSNITICILAAGESRRMNDTIKQLLPWGNTTLVGNAIEQAKKTANTVFLVLGANAEKIQQAIPTNVETVLNTNWSSGMGASVSCGVNYFQSRQHSADGLLIMLADQPLIDTSYLNELIHTFEQNTFKIVATDYGNRAGVPAIFHTSILDELSGLVQDFGAKHVIQKYADQTLKVVPKGKELDIDTPENYNQLIDKMNS